MLDMKKQKVVQTELFCGECGMKMPIIRKASKKKSKGHLKHMYCPSCKEVQGFLEQSVEDKNVSFWENFQNEQIQLDNN